MIQFTRYDPATGAILGVGGGSVMIAAYPAEPHVKFWPPQDGKHYRVVGAPGAERFEEVAPPALSLADRRAPLYPSLPEQNDALWKIVDALLRGEQPPADALRVRDAVLQVKARFPKDTE